MAVLTLQLAPSYTVTLQPSIRGGAAVGSPIVPTVSGSFYTFNLGALAVGDYDLQVSGNWQINGQSFACRITTLAVYVADFWWQIEAAIVGGSVITPPLSESVCRVQLTARRGSIGIQSRVLITGGSIGRLNDSAFSNIAFDGQTDANGLLQVDLPWSSITGVGKYRFRIIEIETGNVLHDRTALVPDLETALYEDLA